MNKPIDVLRETFRLTGEISRRKLAIVDIATLEIVSVLNEYMGETVVGPYVWENEEFVQTPITDFVRDDSYTSTIAVNVELGGVVAQLATRLHIDVSSESNVQVVIPESSISSTLTGNDSEMRFAGPELQKAFCEGFFQLVKAALAVPLFTETDNTNVKRIVVLPTQDLEGD
jgi:hypothetical protein